MAKGGIVLRLRNYWFIAAASSELGRDPLQSDVEGESLVLFRGSNGMAHALIDRCAHRGMALSHDGSVLVVATRDFRY